MKTDFAEMLSSLRREKGISQKKAAKDLQISQALLSHYENGIREPGLAFVVKACDYFHVSADYLLGRTLDQEGCMIDASELCDVSTERGNVLKGSIMATLHKKLLVNTTERAILSIVMMVVLPLGILGAGIVVVRRRKRR